MSVRTIALAARLDRRLARCRRRRPAFHVRRPSTSIERPRTSRPAIRIPAEARSPHPQYVRTGPDSDRKSTNPPVKALVVYNSNPAAIAPDQTRGPPRPATRRSLHRRARTVPDRHRRFRRHRSARDHVSRTHGSLLRLRPLSSAARPPRFGSARRGSPEHGNLPPSGCVAWVSTNPASRTPTTT